MPVRATCVRLQLRRCKARSRVRTVVWNGPRARSGRTSGPCGRNSLIRRGLPSRHATHYDFGMRESRGATASNAVLFERFVDERRDGLVRFLINLGAGSEDARDTVQDGMLRLLRYKDTAAPEEWTPLSYRIVLNLHRDRQRRESTRGVSVTIDHEHARADLPSPSDSPEQHAIDRQQLMRVKEVIESLSPRCRQVYLLNRMDGLTYPAIADRCGISVKAVEKHISHALRELRRLVDRAPGDKVGG
jgi:RNA polymerase sigma factor (sigma-70 family)